LKIAVKKIKNFHWFEMNMCFYSIDFKSEKDLNLCQMMLLLRKDYECEIYIFFECEGSFGFWAICSENKKKYWI